MISGAQLTDIPCGGGFSGSMKESQMAMMAATAATDRVQGQKLPRHHSGVRQSKVYKTATSFVSVIMSQSKK